MIMHSLHSAYRELKMFLRSSQQLLYFHILLASSQELLPEPRIVIIGEVGTGWRLFSI